MVPPRDAWTPFADIRDRLEHYRLWGLISKKSENIVACYYHGVFTKSCVPCDVLGHQNNRVAIIQIGDELHCIDGEYLASMQPKDSEIPVLGSIEASVQIHAAPAPKKRKKTSQLECETEYVVFDLETTGRNSGCDSIIEIAAVKYSNAEETDRFETLVKPACSIPAFVENLTGIKNSDVLDAPSISAVGPEFLSFVGSLPLVGHNIKSFDLHFLERELNCSLDNVVVDTLPFARKCLPGRASYKLEELKHELGLSTATSHRAMADVLTTNALYRKCLENAPRGALKKLTANKSDSTPSESTGSSMPKFMQNKVDIHAIVADSDSMDQTHPLYGKLIVFTGDLSIPRSEAMQLAVNCGAVLKSSVSQKTNYLIVGQQDKGLVGEDGLSSKEEKAYALNESGKGNIQIIHEEEFLRLVQKEEVCPCAIK